MLQSVEGSAWSDGLDVQNHHSRTWKRLWKALHGLNIKTINIVPIYSIVDHLSSLTHLETLTVRDMDPVKWSMSLSSLTHLKTLSINVWYDDSGLWKALHVLNIKTLCLRELSKSLSSLTHMNMRY
ncbi:hypothetical protein DPMN_061362 [Dreissena polymorpha]|uniref:Uncharacterized protein n=1 Tax=Dreissena polymorpha TaxID=45954 RepID=A0A9D4C6V7_DREPO|nr:hypothetical protein DPMN_061362 [Dreissena polymorpha]